MKALASIIFKPHLIVAGLLLSSTIHADSDWNMCEKLGKDACHWVGGNGTYICHWANNHNVCENYCASAANACNNPKPTDSPPKS